MVGGNRKLEDASSQNKDLLQMIAKREEAIVHNQVRLEEKSRECNTLNRQLEEALEDARRQVCTFTIHLDFKKLVTAEQLFVCLLKAVQETECTLFLYQSTEYPVYDDTTLGADRVAFG